MLRKSSLRRRPSAPLHFAFLLALLLAACAPGSAWQPPDWVAAPLQQPGVDPFVQNQQLGRGINLGNALEAPREGQWGVTLREEFFSEIAAAGFAHIRMPIRWNAYAGDEPPYAISDEIFERVDWVIENALANDLLVVINIHHYEEIFQQPQEQRARFVALWQQIAAHYASAPDGVLFELLNEPHDNLTASVWNEILAETLAVIRQTNPTRNVVIGPGNWYSISGLHSLELPDDPHLIVSIHYYDPFRFTHQGAEWVNGSAPWLGTEWSGSQAQRWDIEADLGQAARWGRQNNRPIYLGEFGAYGKAEMSDRARWTEFVARTAEEMGMSWAYWEFGAGFGAYDRSTGEWRQPLLRALIPRE